MESISKQELQTTIILAGLLGNPVVSQMDPHELVDAAAAFSQLVQDQFSRGQGVAQSIQPSQVALLERLFQQPSAE